MSRLLLSSDLHLGHTNILKFRDGFSSQEEHDEIIFDNLATELGKRDSLILLGDISFDFYWLSKIDQLKCAKKILLLGNHCTDRQIHIRHLAAVYDEIHSLLAKRNIWFSHCPIHPQEFRGKTHNIHGHLHGNNVWKNPEPPKNGVHFDELDSRYINVSVDVTDFKPVTFADVVV